MSHRPGDAYEFVEVLGRGGMAVVELWRQREFGQELVVAKRVYLSDTAGGAAARKEAQILRRLKHPHIVKYLQSWMNKREMDLIIVQEHCPGGDLGQLIRSARKGKDDQPASIKRSMQFLPSSRILRWLAQLVHALRYCHRVHKLLHRDLKPANVFLSKDLDSVLLGDFGIAKTLGSSRSLCNTFIGTQVYMSPEVLRMQQYGLKSDVWGLGLVIYEACTLRRAFEAKGDAIAEMQLIVSPDGPPPFPCEAAQPPELEALCNAMLHKDVSARPTLGELIRDSPVLHDAMVGLEAEIRWDSDSLVPSPEEALGPVEEADVLEEEALPRMGTLHEEALVDRVCRPSTAPPDSPSKMSKTKASGEDELANSHLEKLLLPLQTSALLSLSTVPQPRPPDVPPAAPCRQVPKPPPPDAPPRWARSGASARSGTPVGGAVRSSTPIGATRSNVPYSGVAARSGAVAVCNSSPSDGGTTPSREVALHEVANVRSLRELAQRKNELEAVVAAREDSVPIQHFAEAPSARCQAPDETQKIEARLHCLDVLAAEMPDPAELTSALLKVDQLDLRSEDCGKALVVHAHRLRMQAAETASRPSAPLSAVERAAELLEATRHEAGGSQQSLEHAAERLRCGLAEQRRLGLRCLCGAVVRLLSVRRDASFSQVVVEVARCWQRPAHALHLAWRDGTAVFALTSEEQWSHCLQMHPPGAGPVEVVLRAPPLGDKLPRLGAMRPPPGPLSRPASRVQPASRRRSLSADSGTGVANPSEQLPGRACGWAPPLGWSKVVKPSVHV
eukprot:gnl/TRDRNA2_/TRDRNA2_134513_c0_seq2.p1 gnl/TRDRNA2_/TRDRNA2_134513_c0~~gnl/TRDRNA2_/TRDRNA2_134513_c0_seq2.p1  ORF type:complete len:787 (-),score=145.57 gnl/TRDRNA2_/TRDRNA2_134513_c0_seq2:33-2393(-)